MFSMPSIIVAFIDISPLSNVFGSNGEHVKNCSIMEAAMSIEVVYFSCSFRV